MIYPAGEARILTLIQALSAYDSTNSTRQDWRPLKSGVSDFYVILRPGEWSAEHHAFPTILYTWQTVIEVWRLYRDDAKPVTLQSDVQAIVNQLIKYPTLNGLSGVQDAEVSGGPEMEEVTLKSAAGTGSLWAKWDINVTWKEESTITFS